MGKFKLVIGIVAVLMLAVFVPARSIKSVTPSGVKCSIDGGWMLWTGKTVTVPTLLYDGRQTVESQATVCQYSHVHIHTILGPDGQTTTEDAKHTVWAPCTVTED